MALKSFWQTLEERMREDILKEMKTQAQIREQTQLPSEETIRFERSTQSQLEFDFKFEFKPKSGYAQSTRSRRSNQQSSRIHRPEQRQFTFHKLDLENTLSLELMNRHGANLRWPFSRKDLTRAWRRVALTTHPDRFAGAPAPRQSEAAQNFIALRAAYQSLMKVV